MAVQNATVPHPGAPRFRFNDMTDWIDPILQHDQLFPLGENLQNFLCFPYLLQINSGVWHV
jgi:hypothetical protein